MTVDELVAYCLAKPGATEDYTWGDEELTAKVGGKVFAFVRLDGGNVGLKCGANAEEAAGWRQRYPDASRPARTSGGTGGTRCGCPRVPADEVRELVDASYEDVVRRLPRSKRPKPDRDDRQSTAGGGSE